MGAILKRPKLTREEIRLEACKLAAEVMSCRVEEKLAPTLWCCAVFFESYISEGCKATRKDFGPKPPAKLKIVKSTP